MMQSINTLPIFYSKESFCLFNFEKNCKYSDKPMGDKKM